MKYNLTIPHDWLVKRVFVYIIEKRKLFMPATVEFRGMLKDLKKDRDGTRSLKNPKMD